MYVEGADNRDHGVESLVYHWATSAMAGRGRPGWQQGSGLDEGRSRCGRLVGGERVCTQVYTKRTVYTTRYI